MNIVHTYTYYIKKKKGHEKKESSSKTASCKRPSKPQQQLCNFRTMPDDY